MAFVVQELLRRSGQGGYVLELAGRLARRSGWEVTVLTARAEGALPDGLRVLRCPAAPRSHLLASAALMAWAGRQARGMDLVHGAGANAMRMDVATLHSCHAAWALAAPPAGLRGRLEGRVHRWTERRLLAPRRLRHLITVSERLRREAIEHLGFPPDRVTAIPHGVDAARFRPDPSGADRARLRAALGIPADAFLVLSLGLAAHKGLGPLLEALPALPERTWVLAAGDGDPSPYLARAGALGVGNRVRLASLSEEPASLYRAADALAVLSRYEAFGLPVLEGMASGLPVAVSRAAGASELVAHGADALVVEDPIDKRQVAAALGPLAGDPGLVARLGAAARETALRHPWDRAAEAVFRVHDALLEGRA